MNTNRTSLDERLRMQWHGRDLDDTDFMWRSRRHQADLAERALRVIGGMRDDGPAEPWETLRAVGLVEESLRNSGRRTGTLVRMTSQAEIWSDPGDPRSTAEFLADRFPHVAVWAVIMAEEAESPSRGFLGEYA